MRNQSTVSVAIAAAAKLGVEAAHYDMLFAAPLDDEVMGEVARAGRPIVTVEDGARAGGFGSAVLEWLADHGYSLNVKRIGVPDKFVAHGSIDELRRICGMDSASIAEAIVASANKPTR